MTEREVLDALWKAADKDKAPTLLPYEITPQLRWRDGRLQQAWRTPDNLLDWRDVPHYVE